ncbi:hypothetical protein RFI_05192 [Reticulomyxa filosa]|uniref:Uncharacterized protein n=1 Tax=Reticulomyxa filosa TaxID=46433 RepID=X6P2Z1_RETFI|nr:hypothetical protein RFI_05192 [Reticulomyxa filosa]|eukprot:ETO31927.1 hypothetical protein RFI_05192 [Reticulomyxa filosa]
MLQLVTDASTILRSFHQVFYENATDNVLEQIWISQKWLDVVAHTSIHYQWCTLEPLLACRSQPYTLEKMLQNPTIIVKWQLCYNHLWANPWFIRVFVRICHCLITSSQQYYLMLNPDLYALVIANKADMEATINVKSRLKNIRLMLILHETFILEKIMHETIENENTLTPLDNSREDNPDNVNEPEASSEHSAIPSSTITLIRNCNTYFGFDIIQLMICKTFPYQYIPMLVSRLLQMDWKLVRYYYHIIHRHWQSFVTSVGLEKRSDEHNDEWNLRKGVCQKYFENLYDLRKESWVTSLFIFNLKKKIGLQTRTIYLSCKKKNACPISPFSILVIGVRYYDQMWKKLLLKDITHNLHTFYRFFTEDENNKYLAIMDDTVNNDVYNFSLGKEFLAELGLQYCTTQQSNTLNVQASMFYNTQLLKDATICVKRDLANLFDQIWRKLKSSNYVNQCYVFKIVANLFQFVAHFSLSLAFFLFVQNKQSVVLPSEFLNKILNLLFKKMPQFSSLFRTFILVMMSIILITFVFLSIRSQQYPLTEDKTERQAKYLLTLTKPVEPVIEQLFHFPTECKLIREMDGSTLTDSLLIPTIKRRNKVILGAIFEKQFPQKCSTDVKDYWILNVANIEHTKVSMVQNWFWLAHNILTAVALNKTMIYFDYISYNRYVSESNNPRNKSPLRWIYEPSQHVDNATFGMDCYFQRITHCNFDTQQLTELFQNYPEHVNEKSEMSIHRDNVTVPFWNKQLLPIDPHISVGRKWNWQQLVMVALQFLLRFNPRVLYFMSIFFYVLYAIYIYVHYMYTERYVRTAMIHSFPANFDPANAMSIPIRHSDKCTRFDNTRKQFVHGEMDCFSLEEHLEIAEWIRTCCNPSLRYLIITSEDKRVFEELDTPALYEKNAEWIIIRNEFDSMPGSGNPRTWNQSQSGESLVLSVLSTLQMHTLATYFQATIASTWSRFIVSMQMEWGCGYFLPEFPYDSNNHRHVIILQNHNVNLPYAKSIPRGQKFVVLDNQLYAQWNEWKQRDPKKDEPKLYTHYECEIKNTSYGIWPFHKQWCEFRPPFDLTKWIATP